MGTHRRKLSVFVVCLVALGCGGMRSSSVGPSVADPSAGEALAQRHPGGYAPSMAAEESAMHGADSSFGGSSAASEHPSPAPSAPPPSPGAGSAGAEPGARIEAVTTVTVETITAIEIPDPRMQQLQQPQALLTAASVGDHDRRQNYLDFLARHPHESQRLGLDMTRRLRVRVTDGQGAPANDAAVSIAGRSVGRTHADGVFDFYPSLHGVAGRAVVTVAAGQHRAQTVIEMPTYGDAPDVEVRLTGAQSLRPQTLDLAFLIDVTGSMEDELRYVNAEIGDIVRGIQQSVPETRVRVAATLYRDRTDREVVQQIPFTTNIAGLAQALRTVHAAGGGDYPEDMNAGLDAALNRLDWSEGNAVRTLVLIADAPPKRYHDAQFTYVHAMSLAARDGIRILPVAASGSDRSVEFLFRALATASSAPYVYLTDDSGIGNPHLEADTDRVAVEYFADLLTRLLVSDLRGHGMHEPGAFGGQQ